MILRKQWTGFSCKSNASSLLPIKEDILQISTFRYRTKQSCWCWWHRSDTEAYARAEIKGTRSLPLHSSKLLNIMSSLLLLPKTKFPIGKKNPKRQTQQHKPGRKIRVVHSTIWHISQKLLQSLKHYCIFHTTQNSSFSQVIMLQSLQQLILCRIKKNKYL